MTDQIKSKKQRVSFSITGAVQGVGFRPFIFQLANDLGLAGFVCNSSSGVMIEAEGPLDQLQLMIKRIPEEKPQHSFIQNYHYHFLDPIGFDGFTIKESDAEELKTAVVLPDIATCPECLKEVLDPQNRRFMYPFTNCTHCGPRYSIIEALPYDRANTSMSKFVMCPACQSEYDDETNRRFHAQPNACPECGPYLEFWDVEGKKVSSRQDAMSGAVAALDRGKIIAVKGLGGFHLIVDAHNDEGVRRLRERKGREEKPFASMFPSMEMIEEQCIVSEEERALIKSGESPIVLVPKRKDVEFIKQVAPSVAPGNPNLGVMLPYSPLHHILLSKLGRAVVATSANLSEEPICTDEKEAVQRLGGIADMYLVHNRPIVRSIDDSVVRIMMGRPLVLRRARGYAPLPVTIRKEGPTTLSMGGHLKNTVSLNVGANVFISQHIGDLSSKQTFIAFQKALESLKDLYGSNIQQVACDMHPDYLSTKFAESLELPVVRVQHHYAHVVSCMAENHLDGTVLGIVWDGAGYGRDGTVWGGEFLRADLNDYIRTAHFKTFLLPGGDKASVEPRRVGVAILAELEKVTEDDDFTDLAPIKSFTPDELKVLKDMLKKKINAPETSSVGRLFDAVASLININQTLRFEGQAAMALEYILEGADIDSYYTCPVKGNKAIGFEVDWTDMFREIVSDIRGGIKRGVISVKFHNALVEAAVNVAKQVGEKRIVLSGGCFQNKYLTERMVKRLGQEGFKVYWHQLVPPNDGGISLGQCVYAVNQGCVTRDP